MIGGTGTWGMLKPKVFPIQWLRWSTMIRFNMARRLLLTTGGQTEKVSTTRIPQMYHATRWNMNSRCSIGRPYLHAPGNSIRICAMRITQTFRKTRWNMNSRCSMAWSYHLDRGKSTRTFTTLTPKIFNRTRWSTKIRCNMARPSLTGGQINNRISTKMQIFHQTKWSIKTRCSMRKTATYHITSIGRE
jgi:hypothetical protein